MSALRTILKRQRDEILGLTHNMPAEKVKEYTAEINQAISEYEALRTSLKEMRTLASVCIEGDPWYAEHAGLNVRDIFAKAQHAIGDEDEPPVAA